MSVCPSLSLSFKEGSHAPVLDDNCQGCALCYECAHGAIIPEAGQFTTKIARTWARLFYKDIPRKTLDERELALLDQDRFAIMKSRPELMQARRPATPRGASNEGLGN